MKRILMSLGAIVFVGAAVWGATGAFFSDTETSTGNTFSAGSVDLTITGLTHTYNGSPTNQPTFSQQGFAFNLSDLKPVDSGTINYTLANGSNQAYICAAVVETGNADNGVNEPETQAGDTTDGAGNGELGQFLSFMFGSTTATTTLNGAWQSLGIVNGSGATSTSISYCFGQYSGGVCQDAATSTVNIAQTDSLTADVQFYAVQTRNNPSFTCSSLPPATATPTPPTVVTQNDLFLTSTSHAVGAGDKWFFYNDTNDTSMSIDQFSGTSGQNHMALTAGVEGALMTLGTEVTPRYNIATYRFGGTLLSAISTLKYRVYDATVDGDKPFLNFNVDFNNSNVWQNRLVYVPTTLTAGTWTTVDAIQGGTASWTYSGANWPAPNAQPGTTPKTWSQILADYPNAKILSSDPWLGVRVGEPGPAAASATVDYLQFNATTYDFKI